MTAFFGLVDTTCSISAGGEIAAITFVFPSKGSFFAVDVKPGEFWRDHFYGNAFQPLRKGDFWGYLGNCNTVSVSRGSRGATCDLPNRFLALLAFSRSDTRSVPIDRILPCFSYSENFPFPSEIVNGNFGTEIFQKYSGNPERVRL
jgi:hypothetical protein